MKSQQPHIVLIRHAQTAFGESQKFMGTLDIPCSNVGVSHAHIASQLLNKYQFVKIYSSPLRRAFQTAQALFPSYKITIEDKLIERGLGEWAGKDLNTIKEVFPEGFYATGIINPFYTPKGGEAIEALIQRVNRFINEIEENFKSQIYSSPTNRGVNIAIVSHNGVIRVMRSIFENFPISKIFTESEKYLEPVFYKFSNSTWHQVDNIE